MKAFVITAAVLALSACGSSDSGTIETEDGEVSYTVDDEGGEINATFTNAEGETMTVQGGGAVAANLPDGFSVYPGAKVVSSTNVSTGESNGAMILLESGDAPEAVVSFYRQEAEAAGVEIQMEMTANDARIVSGESPAGLVFSINATPTGDGTTSAHLTIGTKS